MKALQNINKYLLLRIDFLMRSYKKDFKKSIFYVNEIHSNKTII